MEASRMFSNWFFQPELWVILGIVLVIVDIWIGFGLIILPIGIAALLIAALLYGQMQTLFGEEILFSSWRTVLIWFAGLSVVSVGLIQVLFQRLKKNRKDINRY